MASLEEAFGKYQSNVLNNDFWLNYLHLTHGSGCSLRTPMSLGRCTCDAATRYALIKQTLDANRDKQFVVAGCQKELANLITPPMYNNGMPQRLDTYSEK